MQIWKNKNIHVGKHKCEKCKRVSKESKYMHIKNYEVTFNRKFKPNKEKDIKATNRWKCV